ncbi:4-methyl-5(B-hydroxyethyl)-thiazole monophosphate biosynthesis protein [Betaproteobacteria bacterium]|nr:4-methyl-5(B-hydroxyethyl)-thiazole monophosphate biosynthesis protein [Betaproteobacteria bacterium]GHU45073.1 4-methyl-5(B-hydroxyethyl)-thiazole monophosphate biosynthesis protein [Betaproteobacteria bacterium]
MSQTHKVALFLIDGFEETEAITTLDILRRGEVTVTTISLSKKAWVTSKHGVTLQADTLFEEASRERFDMLVIPGGTLAYTEHTGLLDWVRQHHQADKPLAAICAAPAVFGKAGILQGKKAVCYPGMESYLTGALIGHELVVTDGNLTTSRGPATAIFFALRLLELLRGSQVAKEVGDDFMAPLIL